MTWQIPNWWTLALLSLAAFRTWRLIAEDSILDRPHDWLMEHAPAVDEFLMCPWCAGLWLATGWWLAWIWQPHWSLVAATPAAISAVVGLVAANIDPIE